MAGRISEKNYLEMIDALQSFASNIQGRSEEMLATAHTCAQALGDGDEAVEQILLKINGCRQKYENASAQAISIAKAMMEELEEQRKEREVWRDE